MNGNTSLDPPLDRVTVPEAAKMMGVTQSAIRKRVHRGTIPWDKDHEGRIYVYVDPSEMSPETRGGKARETSVGQSGDELLEAYRDQVEFLRRELERKDTLLISLMQRVPELEPAKDSSTEMREPLVSPSEEADKGVRAPRSSGSPQNALAPPGGDSSSASGLDLRLQAIMLKMRVNIRLLALMILLIILGFVVSVRVGTGFDSATLFDWFEILIFPTTHTLAVFALTNRAQKQQAAAMETVQRQ